MTLSYTSKQSNAHTHLKNLILTAIYKCLEKRYYWGLLPLCNLILPVFILWLVSDYSSPGATLYQLICYNYAFYITELHFTWLVNSAAHMYGYRPYDTYALLITFMTKRQEINFNRKIMFFPVGSMLQRMFWCPC
jgi:fatty-acid desaturase